MIFLKAYTRKNLGDDLLIRLVCNDNKDKQFCILADEDYKEIFKDIKNLEIMSEEFKTLEKLKENQEAYYVAHEQIYDALAKKCDVFLYVGGSIFIEWSHASLVGLKKLKSEFIRFKHSYIIGANFGPHKTKDFFDYLHDEIIPNLTHISFRDLESYNLFKDLDNVKYAPDIVFTLDSPAAYKKKKELGISLVHHLEREQLKLNYNTYLESVLKFAGKYIKNDYTIRLLSFCTYEKDDIVITDFLEKMTEEEKSSVKIEHYNGNIDEFLDLFSSFDTVVATRFHAIVLGMKYSCKLFPICYSNKAINMLSDLNITNLITFSNISDLNNVESVEIDRQKLKELNKEANIHFDYKKLF